MKAICDSLQPAAARGSAIAELLAPIDEYEFFDTCWERRPLHIRRGGDCARFGHLLDIAAMNTMLSHALFRIDEVKVARNEQIVPASAYVAAPGMPVMGRVATDHVDTTRLLGLFEQGATLVFAQLDHKWPPLQSIRRRLQNELCAAVLANVFLSNRHAQGYSVHYDTHDVFVLQLHGAKRWALYGSPIELPLRSQPFGRMAVEPGPLSMEVDVQAHIVAGATLPASRTELRSAQ